MNLSLSRGILTRRGVLLLAALPILTGATQDIRIVTYNTQADVGTGGDSGPTPTTVLGYLPTVIEGIGQQKYVGDGILQVPDIIALQETTSNSATVAPLVSSLNSFYGNTNYNYSSVQATTSDGTTYGGGPNALIYDQATISLNRSDGVGTPASASNGEYRQIMRYQFQPLADKGTNNGFFYVYDSHYKSGGASTTPTGSSYNDGQLRNLEAQILRNDESTLPSNASVLYVGDFNGDGSTETAYQTLTAASSPSGVAQGEGIDPLNPPNSSGVVNYGITWTGNNSNGLLTETDTSLYYRDDLQMMTANVYNGSGAGLHLISGSYHTFGNNGSVSTNGNVNTSSNTAVNDIVGNGSLTKMQVLGAENGSLGSDHLPIVADYSISILANGIWAGGTGNWSNAANWSNNVVPNSASIEVKIDNSNPVNSVVTLDQVAVISDLILDSGDQLNIGAGETLTMSGSTTTLLNGSLSNSGTLSGSNIVNTGSFNTSGIFAASGVFNNSGSATFSGTQTWRTNATLLNTAGTTSINSDAGNPSTSPLNVNVSGGTVTFGSVQHLNTLTLASGATVVASLPSSHSNHVLITTGSLTLGGTTSGWQGSLDLTGNDLDVQSGSLSDITSQVQQGFNGGAWNGANGITSSAAAADTTHLTALGVIQNNQSGSAIFTGNKQFDNSTPAVGAILVKYTYYGDANLSGNVDGSDYTLIDSGFVTHATGWFNGDFNYDGVINGSDYTLIDNAFNNQGAVLTSAIADPTASIAAEIATSVAVPEPSTLGLLVVASGALLGRRRLSLRGF